MTYYLVKNKTLNIIESVEPPIDEELPPTVRCPPPPPTRRNVVLTEILAERMQEAEG